MMDLEAKLHCICSVSMSCYWSAVARPIRIPVLAMQRTNG